MRPLTRATEAVDKRAGAEGREARREAPRARLRERSGAPEVARSTRSDELAPPQGGALDTLAQLGQKQSSERSSDPRVRKADTLKRRARAKYFTTPLAIQLAMLRSSLENSYRNTAYCSGTLNQHDGRITGTYCGNRWCMVCNRIRTARAILRYLPTVESWPDKHLVMLTVKNVTEATLPHAISEMIQVFQATELAMRRTDRAKLIALRKLECTYNYRTGEYHPHFHVIVASEQSARLLVLRWLARHQGRADIKGQDIRRCDNGTAMEVFKYFTKMVAKTRIVPPAILAVIFQSMKGHRVYQPVGFTIPRNVSDESAESIAPVKATEAPTRPGERISWEWCQSLADWVDLATGECLTGYEPEEAFRLLVEGESSESSHSQYRCF